MQKLILCFAIFMSGCSATSVRSSPGHTPVDFCMDEPQSRQYWTSHFSKRFEGEVSGLIRAGAFVRFGGRLGDVYEGFVPARRIRGERFELNEEETSLVGSKTGRKVSLGDALDVLVEKVEAARGRVDLDPAD